MTCLRPPGQHRANEMPCRPPWMLGLSAAPCFLQRPVPCNTLGCLKSAGLPVTHCSPTCTHRTPWMLELSATSWASKRPPVLPAMSWSAQHTPSCRGQRLPTLRSRWASSAQACPPTTVRSSTAAGEHQGRESLWGGGCALSRCPSSVRQQPVLWEAGGWADIIHCTTVCGVVFYDARGLVVGLTSQEHPCGLIMWEQPTHPVRLFLPCAGRAGAVNPTSGAMSSQILAMVVGPTTQTRGRCASIGTGANPQCPGTAMTRSAW